MPAVHKRSSLALTVEDVTGLASFVSGSSRPATLERSRVIFLQLGEKTLRSSAPQRGVASRNQQKMLLFDGFRFQFALRVWRAPTNLRWLNSQATQIALRSDHGVLSLERLPVVRATFDSYSSVHCRARRPYRA